MVQVHNMAHDATTINTVIPGNLSLQTHNTISSFIQYPVFQNNMHMQYQRYIPTSSQGHIPVSYYQTYHPASFQTAMGSVPLQIVPMTLANGYSNCHRPLLSIAPNHSNHQSPNSVNFNINISQEKPVGNGAFGVVWQVFDPRTEEKVALKRITNVYSSTISAQRVFREMKMLMTLNHQNVINLKDVVQDDLMDGNSDEVNLLCEYMDADLHKVISMHMISSPIQVQLFFYQLLRGLKYLHSANIVHRDLKPGNLLVNRGNSLLKICDFGLAREISSSTSSTCSTNSNGSVGSTCSSSNQASLSPESYKPVNFPLLSEEPDASMTPHVVTQYYRAPELLLGSKRYSEAVDMWSAGCIFGEMITSRIMFEVNNQLQQLATILEVTGIPKMDSMTGCELKRLGVQWWPAASMSYMRAQPARPVNEMFFRQLLHNSPFTVKGQWSNMYNLFTGLLDFNPSARMTATEALESPYLAEGRNVFHKSVCTCCPRTPSLAATDSSVFFCYNKQQNQNQVVQLPIQWPTSAMKPNFYHSKSLNAAAGCIQMAVPHTNGTAHHQAATNSDDDSPLLTPTSVDSESQTCLSNGALAQFVRTGQNSIDFSHYEPVFRGTSFNFDVNDHMESIDESRRKISNLVNHYYYVNPRPRVIINAFSPNYRSFMRSRVTLQQNVMQAPQLPQQAGILHGIC